MPKKQETTRIVIMGAAGRDFHNFNVAFRDDPKIRVIAFTAAQIPEIAGRRYPTSLAGPLYPEGIPIVDESELAGLCRQEGIDRVIFAYSDVTHAHVMHMGSVALACGADFVLLGPKRTMLKAKVPVIAVSAVRTGCGKSQTTRWLSRLLLEQGLRSAVIRHPMPYGNLEREAVQRFATPADLDSADCTIEEREEYEPHVALGTVVYAGIDYAEITVRAEHEADLILWDGGNNDFPFLWPDLHIVLIDPLRPNDVGSHHPGETVLRTADIVVVAKTDSAREQDIQTVVRNARAINPDAPIVYSASPVRIEEPELVRGKRVLVVEDGPTLTHGGMAYGAGYVAAEQAGAAAITDPREIAVDEIADVFVQYPHLGPVLPAVGYHRSQLAALEATINAANVDAVVAATPCDLGALIEIDKPLVRVRYEFAEVGEPGLGSLVQAFLSKRNL